MTEHAALVGLGAIAFMALWRLAQRESPWSASASTNCSGHSFKHASALGDLAAQWVCVEELFTDTSSVDPRRWAAARTG